MNYRCPVCLSEIDTVYIDQDRNPIGCEDCISSSTADAVLESEEEKADNDYANYAVACARDERYGYA